MTSRLLGWVHATEVDSFLTTYRVFGAEPLDEGRCRPRRPPVRVCRRQTGMMKPPRTVASRLKQVLAVYRPELELAPAAKKRRDVTHGPATGRCTLRIRDPGRRSGVNPVDWARTALLLPVLPTTDRLVVRPLTGSARAYPLGPHGLRLSCLRGCCYSRRCLLDGSPSTATPAPRLVSFVVSFGHVQPRPRRASRPSVRRVADIAGQARSAVRELESA